jgi:hypothetical protein
VRVCVYVRVYVIVCVCRTNAPDHSDRSVPPASIPPPPSTSHDCAPHANVCACVYACARVPIPPQLDERLRKLQTAFRSRPDYTEEEKSLHEKAIKTQVCVCVCVRACACVRVCGGMWKLPDYTQEPPRECHQDQEDTITDRDRHFEHLHALTPALILPPPPRRQVLRESTTNLLFTVGQLMREFPEVADMLQAELSQVCVSNVCLCLCSCVCVCVQCTHLRPAFSLSNAPFPPINQFQIQFSKKARLFIPARPATRPLSARSDGSNGSSTSTTSSRRTANSRNSGGSVPVREMRFGGR